MICISRWATKPAERVLVITRVFDAPRRLVFKAWIDPEQVMRWRGPKGFTTPFCKIDLRPGGVFPYCMRSPEGLDFWGLEVGFSFEIWDLEFVFFSGSSVPTSLGHEHLPLLFLTGETMPGVEPMGISGQEHSHTAP